MKPVLNLIVALIIAPSLPALAAEPNDRRSSFHPTCVFLPNTPQQRIGIPKDSTTLLVEGRVYALDTNGRLAEVRLPDITDPLITGDQGHDKTEPGETYLEMDSGFPVGPVFR